MFNRPASPCPIPRCALEWYLTAQAAVAGTFVWLSGDPRFGHYDICFSSAIHIPMSSMRWGICLWLVAAVQVLAVRLAPVAPQTWAAGIAAFAWAAFAMSTWHGGMVAFACPIAALAALGELYVCAMLWGGRWRP